MENTGAAAIFVWKKLTGKRQSSRINKNNKNDDKDKPNTKNTMPSSSPTSTISHKTDCNSSSSSPVVAAGKTLDEAPAPAAIVLDEEGQQQQQQQQQQQVLIQSATAHYKFGNIEAMPIVTKSPYESNHQSAEVGEPLFERLKILLLSQEEFQGEELFQSTGFPTLTVQEETKRVFGQVLADSVVKASFVIGSAGILFSPSWLEDKECKIRSVKCGWISKPMMLLLLQEQRLCKGAEASLNSVINNIGVLSILFDALKEWKLEDPRLVSNAPSLRFATKRSQCFKCVIFIARVYRCCKVLETRGDDEEQDFQDEHPGLFAKVQQCVEILKGNVKVNPKRLEEYESNLQQEQRRKQDLLNLAKMDNSRRRKQAAAKAAAEAAAKAAAEAAAKVAVEAAAKAAAEAAANAAVEAAAAEAAAAEAAEVVTKPEKKRKRVSGTLTVHSTGSSLSNATSLNHHASPTVTPVVVAAPVPAVGSPPGEVAASAPEELERNGNHHLSFSRGAEQVAGGPSPQPQPSISATSVEALLAVSEKQFKGLGKTLKKIRREMKKTRDDIREEVRAELMEEFGLEEEEDEEQQRRRPASRRESDARSSSRRGVLSSNKRRKNGTK